MTNRSDLPFVHSLLYWFDASRTHLCTFSAHFRRIFTVSVFHFTSCTHSSSGVVVRSVICFAFHFLLFASNDVNLIASHNFFSRRLAIQYVNTHFDKNTFSINQRWSNKNYHLTKTTHIAIFFSTIIVSAKCIFFTLFLYFCFFVALFFLSWVHFVLKRFYFRSVTHTRKKFSKTASNVQPKWAEIMIASIFG